VRFAAGVQALRGLGCMTFVETGPGPVLSGMARRIVTDKDCRWLPALRPGRGDWEQLLGTVGELYAAGIDIDWAAVDRGRPRRKVALPTYPFERTRYWPEIKPRQSRTSGAEPAEVFRDWLYEPDWQPLVDDSVADYLPSPARLQEVAGSEAEALYRQMPPADDAAAYREMDGLCRDYILDAFASLRGPLRPGERFSSPGLRTRMGIIERYHRLFERLLQILAEDGMLKVRAGEWVVGQMPPRESAERQHTALAARHPLYEAELSVLKATAPMLAEVLTGRADPMQLLFPGGSLDLASRLYYDARPVPLFNNLIGRCMAEAIRSLPEGRTIHILEIGAGTGGTTAVVLPQLPPDRARYTFTDVSPQFLDRARRRFGNYPFVDYRLFDLDEAVAGQGLACGSYDIVIAANVVHATRDLGQSLGRIKELLKPEGLALLLEVIRPQRFGDLTIGLTGGWWGFDDTALRPNSAFIPEARWLKLFRESGFDESAAVPGKAVEKTGLFANQSVLLARKPATVPVPAARGRWLLWIDEQGIGRNLANRLRERGEECLIVCRGNRFESLGLGEYRINPSDPADHRRMIEAFRDSGECRGAVYVWGEDGVMDEESDLAAIRDAVAHACRGALCAIQGALGAGGLGGCPLAFVTRGAQAGRTTRRPAQTALWAMAGVLAAEHPELHCRRIDLDFADNSDASTVLLEELLRRDAATPDQIILEEGTRRTLRFKRSVARELCYPPRRLDPDAAYLVTGGLTGLGLETAAWLVQRGARHLALVGRRPPGEQAQAGIEVWGRAGVTVASIQADIGDAADAGRVFAAVDALGVPLRGVIHCAGALDDAALLQNMDWERFERVLKAKVDGGWNLHVHSRSAALDFFVVYSSGTSLLCPAGLASYAAANAFLDGLALYRKSLGLPGLSINWGPWRETSAVANQQMTARLESAGMAKMDTLNGFKALECLLAADAGQVAVLPIDWARFPGGTGMFAGLEPEGSHAMAEQPAIIAGDWRDKLEGALPDRRRTILQSLVGAEAARILKLKGSQMPDPRQSLQELGLDSLMAVEFRNTLATLAGVELPPTLLFNHPSVDQLTDHLAACMAAGGPVPEGPAASATGESALDIDAMSEEELARLLEEQIKLA